MFKKYNDKQKISSIQKQMVYPIPNLSKESKKKLKKLQDKLEKK